MLSKSSFKNQSRYDSESSDIVFVLSHSLSNIAVLTKCRKSGNGMLKSKSKKSETLLRKILLC